MRVRNLTMPVVFALSWGCLLGAPFGCAGSDASGPTATEKEDAAEGGTTKPSSDGGGGSDGSSSSIDAADEGAVGANGDPNMDGPFAVGERDATATIATTTDDVAVHVAFPSTAAGPFPLVIFAHGFSLPSSQYYGYLKRLASFGYVALAVDYPTSFLGNDNPQQAKDLVGAIDWAQKDSALGAKVDSTNVGVSGHSLGGKLALLAATMDTRIKASFVLDPVDGGANGCNPPNCVVVKSLVGSLSIPTGFIGETTDATGTFQACAPAADNFTTFYAQTKSPSVEVTALGANHMSFLDDASTCGITCSFCNSATASNADVNAMARAFMVAFYERYLRGKTAYDSYLTGAEAKARYVTTSKATIVSK